MYLFIVEKISIRTDDTHLNMLQLSWSLKKIPMLYFCLSLILIWETGMDTASQEFCIKKPKLLS